jgi:hypothetical protein
MDFSNYFFASGEGHAKPFIQVQIETPLPMEWVAESRHVLAFLLESFNGENGTNASTVRAFGLQLLASFYPLPAQFDAFAEGKPVMLNNPPYSQTGGFYLTSWGLQLRFESSETVTVEDVQTVFRSLLALSMFSGYDLNDDMRQRLFALLDAFIPNAHALASLAKLPLHKHENKILGKLRNDADGSLRFVRSLKHPAETLNANFFKAMSYLYALDGFDKEMTEVLEIVATGTRGEN